MVPEAVPNADGTVGPEMHPWAFLGALNSGKGDCPPSASFTFGSVKDFGMFHSQPNRPVCDYSTEEKDDNGERFVYWTAACPTEIEGVKVLSLVMLGVAVNPIETKPGKWSHPALYTKTLATKENGETEEAGNCIFTGWVIKRDAAK